MRPKRVMLMRSSAFELGALMICRDFSGLGEVPHMVCHSRLVCLLVPSARHLVCLIRPLPTERVRIRRQ